MGRNRRAGTRSSSLISCQLLVDAMAAGGWTVGALAARAGVAPRTVCRYRVGARDPGLRHVTWVATVLGLDPRSLWRAIDGAARLRERDDANEGLVPQSDPYANVRKVQERILVLERMLQAMGNDLRLLREGVEGVGSGS